jgi:hypothetical protein
MGKCAVLVCGFDFGTTEEQVANYMSGAGTVVNLQMFDKGTACVTYRFTHEAQAAVQGFNQTIIPGNSRYLDVLPMDPEDFLARHNIESDKCMQFMAMSPEQQQAIMAKGSLSNARDPNAVLATRMQQIGSSGKGSLSPAQGCGGAGNSTMGMSGPFPQMSSMGQVASGSKGSFGPAQGCGGGMKGGPGSSPYGGGGSEQGGCMGQDGKGEGNRMEALMNDPRIMKVAQMFAGGDWGSDAGKGWW